MSDYEESRKEERDEDRVAAVLALYDMKTFARSRCCLYLVDADDEILHGRLEGLLLEVNTLVLRDLRPGRERLQARLQVPYDNVLYACHSGSLQKCKACLQYQEMERRNRRAAKKKG